jgi:hypothetical protein
MRAIGSRLFFIFVICMSFGYYKLLAQTTSICPAGDTYMVLSDVSFQTVHVMKFTVPGTEVTNTCLNDIVGGEGVVIDYTNKIAYLAGDQLGNTITKMDLITGASTEWFNPSVDCGDIGITKDNNYLILTDFNGPGFKVYFHDISSGTFPPPLYHTLTIPGSGNGTWGVATDPNTGTIYVTTDFASYFGTSAIYAINPVTLSVSGGPIAPLNSIESMYAGIEVDADGNIWAVVNNEYSGGIDKVRKINPSTGAILKECSLSTFTSGRQFALVIGPDGNVYIGSDASNACVIQVNTSTCVATTFVPQPPGGGGTTKGLEFVCTSNLPNNCISTCTIPTATVTPTNPSCTGANAPNNGMLTVNAFTTGQKYQYSTGATFNSVSAIPTSITAIPGTGVILENLKCK